MRRHRLTRLLPVVGALVTGLLLALPLAANQDAGGPRTAGATAGDATSREARGGEPDAADPTPVEYSALAVRTTTTPAATVPVTITIERWSTEAEQQKLYTALAEQGPDKLLDVLQQLPSLGRFSSTGTVGYELHYATQSRTPEGGSRVSLATNRWISFGEAASGGRSLDYPFTVIELRLNEDGEGEGKMSFATQIGFNRELNILTLENYENQPVLLQGVKRVD